MDTYLEFASNHVILVTALMGSLFLLIFTELRRKAGGITNIEPQAAVSLINADAVVVDLRIPVLDRADHLVLVRAPPGRGGCGTAQQRKSA